MAKKRFKEGLESLFGEPEPKPLSLFPEEEKVTVEVHPRKKREDTSGSHKRFTNKLDAFLAEAFEEVEAEEKKGKEDKRKRTTSAAQPRRRSGSGLDILIRNTSAPRPKEERPEPNTKRLTVVIEKDKLEKLKEIARRKDAYLKDIIGELVAAYISETK